VSRDVALYVDDMIEACRRITRYSKGLDRPGLMEDTKSYDAVLRNLEILGEACKRVPAEVRARDNEIAWRRIAALRDVLAHAYFGVDEDIIWNVVSIEIPLLLPQLMRLRSTLESA
jgi:uncharacterized protein with HEPN domain